MDVDQTVMVDLALEKEGVQIHNSQRFRHFLNMKSGQPMLEIIIRFSKHEKVKSFHADITIKVSSF